MVAGFDIMCEQLVRISWSDHDLGHSLRQHPSSALPRQEGEKAAGIRFLRDFYLTCIGVTQKIVVLNPEGVPKMPG